MRLHGTRASGAASGPCRCACSPSRLGDQQTLSPKKTKTRSSCVLSFLSLLYVMVSHFPSPVLSLSSDALQDLDGHDALSGLWTGTSLYPTSPPHFFFGFFLLRSPLSIPDVVSLSVFTKCKESLQDGRRLENISWRLWYRELAAHTRAQRHLPTPPHESPPHSPHPHPVTCPLTPVSEKGSRERPGKFFCLSRSITLTNAYTSAIQDRVPSPQPCA